MINAEILVDVKPPNTKTSDQNCQSCKTVTKSIVVGVTTTVGTVSDVLSTLAGIDLANATGKAIASASLVGRPFQSIALEASNTLETMNDSQRLWQLLFKYHNPVSTLTAMTGLGLAATGITTAGFLTVTGFKQIMALFGYEEQYGIPWFSVSIGLAIIDAFQTLCTESTAMIESFFSLQDKFAKTTGWRCFEVPPAFAQAQEPQGATASANTNMTNTNMIGIEDYEPQSCLGSSCGWGVGMGLVGTISALGDGGAGYLGWKSFYETINNLFNQNINSASTGARFSYYVAFISRFLQTMAFDGQYARKLFAIIGDKLAGYKIDLNSKHIPWKPIVIGLVVATITFITAGPACASLAYSGTEDLLTALTNLSGRSIEIICWVVTGFKLIQNLATETSKVFQVSVNVLKRCFPLFIPAEDAQSSASDNTLACPMVDLAAGEGDLLDGGSREDVPLLRLATQQYGGLASSSMFSRGPRKPGAATLATPVSGAPATPSSSHLNDEDIESGTRGLRNAESTPRREHLPPQFVSGSRPAAAANLAPPPLDDSQHYQPF